MQKLRSFAVYARNELEKLGTDPHSAKSGYIAMIVNRYALTHGMDICCDDGTIPQYIKQKFSADVSSADIFDAESMSWLYQYFVNTDRKNAVDAISGLEIDNSSVTAATQVFTPKWIVQYMIDNSLGRYWAEHTPCTAITEHLPYYIPHTAICNSPVDPEQITVFDPCCGCGNILIYAFDVLMLIYREAGADDATAARSIIRHNLSGADIDPYAAQLARFIITAKAFEYDKDILNSGITPNIEIMNNDTIGSLAYNLSPDSITAKKFDIVCTNPPYLARMSRELKDFASRHIRPYAKDLFTAFMYRGLEYCNDGGYMAYMTPNVWMFLTSHKNIRHYILDNTRICTLLELEKGSYFSEASVDICAFVVQNAPGEDEGVYINPDTGLRNLAAQQNALKAAVDCLRNGKKSKYVYRLANRYFQNTPERILLYRADENIVRLFEKKTIGDAFTVKQGMTTGNNKKFLRYWWQVPYGDIGFDLTDTVTAADSGKSWFPYNKGGKYRKWYGNNDYVVMYADDGKEMKEYTSRLPQGTWVRLKSREYYFKEAVTWSFISSSRFGVRYSPTGSIFDVAGSSLFGDNLEYVLGFLGSKVAFYLLQLINPTMNYQIRDIKALPYIYDTSVSSRVENLVTQCISIAAKDWNNSETSYGFVQNPVVAYGGLSLEKAVDGYINSAKADFDTMKQNETELNSIFIQLYGMNSTLEPGITDDDITLSMPDRQTALRDLLSYCAGISLGRFLPQGGINSIYTPAVMTVDQLCRRVQQYLTDTFGSFDEQYIASVLKVDEKNVLKNYFEGQFIKDHTKKYKNCPIYSINGKNIIYDIKEQNQCQNTQQ